MPLPGAEAPKPLEESRGTVDVARIPSTLGEVLSNQGASGSVSLYVPTCPAVDHPTQRGSVVHPPGLPKG